MAKSMLKRFTTMDYVITVILLGLGFIFLYPVYYTIIISFSDTFNITAGNVKFWPLGFNVSAYKQILSNNRVPLAYWNTILYTAVGVMVNLSMTALTAYPLSRKNMWGRSFFMKLITFTMFFSGGMIPMFLLVSSLGLLNSIWSIVLPNAIWTYQMLIVRSFYMSIPESLHESANIDGASEFRIFLQIMVPLSKPAFATVGLFFFMGHWNNYLTPLIYLKDPAKYPLQVVLRQMLINDDTANYNLAIPDNLTPEAMKNASIVVSMIPVMLIYPFAQKYFVKGMMLGAVKG